MVHEAPTGLLAASIIAKWFKYAFYNTTKVIWLIKGQQCHLASWCHNSPVNNSIDVQQLLLRVSAASTLFPERPHLSIVVYYGNWYFAMIV